MEADSNISATEPVEAAFSLLITDDEIKVLAVTVAVEQLLGFQSEEFISSKVSLKDRIHPDDLDIASILFSPEGSNNSGSFNIRIRDANGKIRCIRGEYSKRPASITGAFTLELLLQDSKSLKRTMDSAETMTNFIAVMENTDDYIYFKDRNHVFTGASQTLVSVCYPAEHWRDLLGLTDYDVFPENYADIYYRLEKEVFAGAQVAREIQEGMTKDGEIRWVDNRKYPIKNELGEIIGLFGVARDITEQRLSENSLRDSEERFRALSEASFGGVGIHDNGIILECNSGLSELTGFTHEELVGMKGLKLIAPEYLDKVIHNIQAEYKERYEVKGVRKDGSVYPLSIRGKNIAYKGKNVRVIEFTDITAQKQTEEVLTFLADYTNTDSKRSFFNHLALFLGTHTGMDFVCIDRLEGDGLNATTLSVWHDGVFEDNVKYSLNQTPCGEAVRKRVCCFTSGVANLFPDDDLLKELQAESYVGLTLWSHAGVPIGLIALVGRKPLQNRRMVETTLQLVSVRAAAELERIDVESALRNYQLMLARTEAISHVGGWEWNLSDNRVRWSEELFRIFKMEPAAEAPAYSEHVSLFPSADFMRFKEVVEKAVNEGKPFNIELTVICSDGSLKSCLSRGTPEMGADNRIVRLFGSLQDITELKQAEKALAESENRFRSLMVNIPTVAVQGYLIDGTTTFWNRASELLYGYTEEEALGANLLELIIPDEMKEDVRAAINNMAETGEPIPAAELSLMRKDGSLVSVFSSHALIKPLGRKPELFCLDIDLSERKRIETELRDAKKAADAANQAKSEFLANMSHEIRTPMNGIIGMSQLLETTFLTSEQKEYISALSCSCNNLLSIINDILDLSKIEAEKLEINLCPFNLRKCITELVSTQKSRIEERGLYCRVDIAPELPDELIGDEFRIKQILLNLLVNAIKFTKNGGITVSASLIERLNTVFVIDIAVKDTGIGIPASAQAHIFEPFNQADGSISNRFGGTGLGLTICRHLTELMGGSIRLESTEGNGSTFYLRLALNYADSAEESLQKSDDLVMNLDVTGLNVLLAEDNQINLLHFTALLRKMGCHVTVANNGREALDRLKTGKFDVVLMDIKMPIMNGDEALRLLRKEESEKGGHQPVIALTAFALKGDRESFIEKGFDGYLSKPIMADELSAELARVLNDKHLKSI